MITEEQIVKYNNTQADTIKSIGFDQHEMIRNIITLHCPEGIECDTTYSKGNFYNKKDCGIAAPKQNS